MTSSSSRSEDKKRGSVSRRSFVKAAGAAGAAGTAGLAGCSGKSDNSSDSTSDKSSTTKKSGGSSDSGKTVIKWAANPQMSDNADKVKQALHDAGLSKDIEVKIISGAWETGKRQQKYQLWLSQNKTTPDLLLMDSGWTVPFIARNQLMNLNNELPKDHINTIKNDYFQSSAKTAQDGKGNIFGVPFFPALPTIQYRKDLVKKAGYDPEGEDWATKGISWKKFSEVTAKTKKQAGTKYGFTFQAKAYEGLSCCDFNEWMSSFGGAYFGGIDNLFGPIGKRPVTVDEEPVKKSIKMIRTFINGQSDSHSLDGYKGNIAPKEVLQWSEETSRKPFTNGDAVMHRNWPYSIKQNGATDVFGKDLGVMPIPWGVKPSNAKYKGTGGVSAALGGWNNTVNPSTKNKKAALEVLKTTMKDDFILSMFELIGYLPPKPKLFNSDKAKNAPVMGRYMDTLKVAGENAVPRPVTVAWPSESTKVSQEVNASLAGQKSPDAAMTQLKKQLKAIEKSAK